MSVFYGGWRVDAFTNSNLLYLVALFVGKRFMLCSHIMLEYHVCLLGLSCQREVRYKSRLARWSFRPTLCLPCLLFVVFTEHAQG